MNINDYNKDTGSSSSQRTDSLPAPETQSTEYYSIYQHQWAMQRLKEACFVFEATDKVYCPLKLQESLEIELPKKEKLVHFD